MYFIVYVRIVGVLHIGLSYVLFRHVLGAFATLRRTTVSFAMSVRPSVVRMAQLGFQLTDFHDM